MFKIENITMKAFDCMDERELLALLKKNLQTGLFEIKVRGDEAEKVITAKLPGGGLGFVKVVQEFGKKSLDEAFDLVEEVCGSLGFEPMVHIDNHHGHKNVAEMSDEELVKFVETYYEGCGFAKLAWGDESNEVVQMAMARGWLIGVLGGPHGATVAVRVTSTNNAVDRTNSMFDAFSLNVPEVKDVLQGIGDALNNTVFANVSFNWLDETFGVVARKLGNGISEIKTV